MPAVFCYGSMLNFESASRSLGRLVSRGDYHVAWLPHYCRAWQVAVPVVLDPKQRPELVRALFLDLRSDPNSDPGCVGAVLHVTDVELHALDRREKQYDRKSVEVLLENHQTVQAEAYIAREEHIADDGVVLDDYKRLIDGAAGGFGPAFRDEFWRSSLPIPQPTRSGYYVFADKEQSRAAGRP